MNVSDKLDGLVHQKKRRPATPVSIDDFLGDYYSKPLAPGQKRVSTESHTLSLPLPHHTPLIYPSPHPPPHTYWENIEPCII